MTTRLSQRYAEQSQLLAEEKWIKNALKKIRNQRNCLQIERLHLEGMKTQLKMKLDGPQNGNNEQTQPDPQLNENIEKPIHDTIDFDDPITDDGCNEELNLEVNNFTYGNLIERDAFDMEEEEDEEEELNGEDLVIDMNMFMNGKPAKWD